MLRSSCLVLALAASATAGDQDYYLSVPTQSAILKVDAVTLQLTPFATGLGIPFYGFFDSAGVLFMADKELGAVLKILPSGQVVPLTAGGLLSSVVTVAPAPGGGLVASDLPLNNVVHVSPSGQQTLIADAVSSGGLISAPGGIAYAPDGMLYVANNVGNTIVRIDPAHNVTLFSASSLINSPGGMVADNAGNLYCAMYNTARIVRFRLDSGEATSFAYDVSALAGCNDLKLSRHGGLLVTTRKSSLLRIHADGSFTQLFQDTSLGEIDGIAVPEDADPCDGSFTEYGAGLAGSGGIVPKLRAIFSPCGGAQVGLEFQDFLGGAPGSLAIGLAPAALPLLGGTLLVSPAGPFVLAPFPLPGTGAGNGDLVLAFGLPENAAFVGVTLYLQALAADPGAQRGLSLSNGLAEFIGD